MTSILIEILSHTTDHYVLATNQCRFGPLSSMFSEGLEKCDKRVAALLRILYFKHIYVFAAPVALKESSLSVGIKLYLNVRGNSRDTLLCCICLGFLEAALL